MSVIFNKYNSLLIDLDDTLMEYYSEEIKAVLKVLENHSLPHTSDVAEVFSEIEAWHTYELGKEITVFDVITNRFGVLLKMLEVKEPDLNNLKLEFFELMQKSHKLKSGVLKTLKYLKTKGYKLYVAANGYTDFQLKRIKSARIINYFDGIFISEQIGCRKPSAAFFNFVMSHIPESNRSRVLIIGDAPSADILGGLNSKIDTCFIPSKIEKSKYKYTYKLEKFEDLINLL